jgi:hypothetical protein
MYRELQKLGEQYDCAVSFDRTSGNAHPVWLFQHNQTKRCRKYVTSGTSCSNSGRLNALAACKRIMRQLKVHVPK